MSRIVLPLLMVAVGLLAGGARKVQGPKGTPATTLAMLKRGVYQKKPGLEWKTLSPDFKRRLSREAGRNVDLADYIMFREANARRPEVRQLVRALRSARVTRVKVTAKGRATVTIRFGGPLVFGISTNVGMVHHKLWRIVVKGEAEAYWGYHGDWASQLIEHEDGSYTVRTRDEAGKTTWEKTFPADQVLVHGTFTRWYFDDLGEAEQHLISVH